MAHNNLAEEGNTNNRPPLFNGTNYSSWKNPMKYHIISEGVEYWKIIIFGLQPPLKGDGELKTELEYDDNDWRQAYINAKAMKLIYCALTVEERNRVNSCTTAKEMWERLCITHEGTNQVRETKINMLLHDYEMFVMREGESISTMLDRFAEIINGLGNLGKHMTDSEKVKKILRSLPKEWDSQVTAIMESKDLNHLEFNALVGSLINYEIILKSRGGRGKPQKSIAFKANNFSVDESDEEIDEEEEDEEISMYARNLRKFKGLLKNRRKELHGEKNEERKRYSTERRNKSYEECWKCGNRGHIARECKSSSSIQKNDRYDKGKKKTSLVATWSDDEEAYQSSDENNLALMASSSLTSDDEDEVTLTYQELSDSFDALQIDFDDAIEINKKLRKKIRDLVSENSSLLETINDLDSPKEDHSACLVEKEKLVCELERLRKEFSYVVGKFVNGNEKFEKLLSLQKYSISKHGLGYDPFDRDCSLISKFTKDGKIAKCAKCLKDGHNEIACKSSMRCIEVKKIWVVKGTKPLNVVYMTNQHGPKMAWVPMRRKVVSVVGTSKE